MFNAALVTGATSGIGTEIALLLSKRQIPLILTGRNQQKLDELSKKLNPIETVVADLSLPGERQRIHQLIEKHVPELVINNAGFGIYGHSLEIPFEKQFQILEVNGKAAVEITLKSAQTLLQNQKHGVILNVSSIAGEYPTPGMCMYGASKAFLTHISQSLDFEFKQHGIRVLVSCPGMVETHFAERAAGKEVKAKGGPVISSENAAKAIWKQIVKRKGKNIFDWRYRILLWITSHFVPKKLVAKMIWKRVMSRK